MATTQEILDKLNGYEDTEGSGIWNDVILALCDSAATDKAAQTDSRFREDHSEGFVTNDGRAFAVDHDGTWSQTEVQA